MKISNELKCLDIINNLDKNSFFGTAVSYFEDTEDINFLRFCLRHNYLKIDVDDTSFSLTNKECIRIGCWQSSGFHNPNEKAYQILKRAYDENN